MERPPRPIRLQDQFRAVIRVNHYSIRTEKSYWYWIRYFIRFHGMKHPKDLAASEVSEFLTWLAVHRNVAVATQNQALNAVLFLYKHVLKKELGQVHSLRAKKPKRVPVVLTKEEAGRVFELLEDPIRLMAQLMYGSGLRLMECCQLRIRDIEFDQHAILVNCGKGNKQRRTVLPESLIPQIERRIGKIRWILRRFRAPLAEGVLGSQYLFATRRFCLHALTMKDEPMLHHISKSTVQRVVRDAIRDARIRKKANCHTLRHSFATELLRSGANVVQIQELLGHKNLKTTMIYLHVNDAARLSVKSPVDGLNVDVS